MKKLMKLTLATVALTGSLAVGAPAKTANAQEVCEDLCCDPSCTHMIYCESIGNWCVCNWGCPGYEVIDP